MGNQVKQQYLQNDNDEWEILDVAHPKKLIITKQINLKQSIFTVIDYDDGEKKKQPNSLFKGPHPETKRKKYPVSKRIQELQHQIGGETLFGIREGKGPIQLGNEGQLNVQQLDDRPILPKKHARKVQNNFNFD